MGVAVLDQPGRESAGLAHPGAQLAAGRDPAELATEQEVQGPGGVGLRGAREVGRQRLALALERGAALDLAIQLGEGAHQFSPPSSVASAAASTPRSFK